MRANLLYDEEEFQRFYEGLDEKNLIKGTEICQSNRVNYI